MGCIMGPAVLANAGTPWGKIARDKDGTVIAERSLVGHCRDVAAVFTALVRHPGVRTRLARVAGRDALEDIVIDRLAMLVHLHDCGRVNAGFQARRVQGAPMVGQPSTDFARWARVRH